MELTGFIPIRETKEGEMDAAHPLGGEWLTSTLQEVKWPCPHHMALLIRRSAINYDKDLARKVNRNPKVYRGKSEASETRENPKWHLAATLGNPQQHYSAIWGDMHVPVDVCPSYRPTLSLTIRHMSSYLSSMSCASLI